MVVNEAVFIVVGGVGATVFASTSVVSVMSDKE